MGKRGFFEKWNDIAEVLGKSTTEVMYDQIELQAKEHQALKKQVLELQSIVSQLISEHTDDLSQNRVR